MSGRLTRALAKVRLARRRMSGRSLAGRLVSIAVCAFAGFMIVTGAVTAQGGDLRPNRNTDLAGLVRQEARRNADLASQVAALRAEVDALAKTAAVSPINEKQTEQAAVVAGLTAVKGPAVSVTLTDAPADVKPVGVDEDLLVVHQQDIQAVVNALWTGGAEAMTIQGQRVSALTGIKCVGNTVVLHGVPYAPPYEIVAIGNQASLEASLASSEYLRIYQQYVRAYGLGYAEHRLDEATLPAYRGSLDISAQRVE